jgi:hypothetical protein
MRTLTSSSSGGKCCNSSLGFATKARACKSAGQERSPRVTFHAPMSAKEHEGMNPYTPKGTPILGVGVPVDFRIFRERLQESKLIGLKPSLYHWKVLGLPLGSPGTKCHLDVALMKKHRVYYKGEGGGFPQVQDVVSLVSPSLPVVCPSTKSVQTMH